MNQAHTTTREGFSPRSTRQDEGAWPPRVRNCLELAFGIPPGLQRDPEVLSERLCRDDIVRTPHMGARSADMIASWLERSGHALRD